MATFSILDYLLKFHSSGFNSRDLERMPDFLDIHRAPALPQLIRLLLERLLAPYLRPVDNGIYDYRFLLHFQREVVYISQFSEQELAAFNFTLDESIAIKQHFHDFRDEQLLLSREVAPILWPESVHPLPGIRRGGSLALPFIDVILGDLHSLDREYDQAQTEYRNAFDGIEPALAAIMAGHAPGSGSGDSGDLASASSVPAFSHFLLYLRTLLKSGLIYEQRRQYDQAAAGYLQAKSLVESALKHPTLRRLFLRAENQIHLYAQPHVSLAFLYAKQDASLERALQHLDDAHAMRQRLDVQDKSPDKSDRSLRGILYVRLYLRQAELLLFRSDLVGAACGFTKAARGAYALAGWPAPATGSQDGHSESVSDGKVHRLHLLGYALSGLGDAAAGLDLGGALGHRHQGCFFRGGSLSRPRAVIPDNYLCNVSVKTASVAEPCRLKEGLERATDLLGFFGGHSGEPDAENTGLIGCPTELDKAVSEFLEALLGNLSADQDDAERCTDDQRRLLAERRRLPRSGDSPGIM